MSSSKSKQRSSSTPHNNNNSSRQSQKKKKSMPSSSSSSSRPQQQQQQQQQPSASTKNKRSTTTNNISSSKRPTPSTNNSNSRPPPPSSSKQRSNHIHNTHTYSDDDDESSDTRPQPQRAASSKNNKRSTTTTANNSSSSKRPTPSNNNSNLRSSPPRSSSKQQQYHRNTNNTDYSDDDKEESSDTSSSKNTTTTCFCCRLPFVLFVALLICGGAGAVIWYFGFSDNSDNSSSNGENTSNGDKNSNGNNNNNLRTPSPTPLVPITLEPTTSTVDEYKFFQCTDESIQSKNCCNGLDGKFCDLRLNEVMFPVVHNAIAAEDNGYPTIPTIDVRPNHYKSLEAALNTGYRGLSLDVCNCGTNEETGKSEYQLCHGVCNVGSRSIIEVFSNIVYFLNTNPTEIIFITIQLEKGLFDELPNVDLNVLYQYFKSVIGLTDLLYTRSNIFEEWPTLRTLVDNNKRLILFHHDGPTCYDDLTACPPGLHYWFTYAIETDFKLESLDEIQNVESSCRITRGGAGGTDISTSFLAVNSFVTPPDPDTALILNDKDFVYQRIVDCSSRHDNHVVNLYYIDYWSVTGNDILEATQTINKNLAFNVK